MRITELFTAKSIALYVAAPDQAAIIDRLVELQATHGNITDKEAYKKALYAREAEGLHLCGQRHHGAPRPHSLRDPPQPGGAAAEHPGPVQRR